MSHRRYSQHNLDRTYSWSTNASADQRRPGSAPMYGRYCYSIHTLPVLKHTSHHASPYSTAGSGISGIDLAKLPSYGLHGKRADPTLVIQTHQGNYGPMEPAVVCVRPARPSSQDGSEHKAADGSTDDSNPKGSEGGSEATSDSQIINQDQVGGKCNMQPTDTAHSTLH